MLQQITKENIQQMVAQFTTAELESMLQKFPYFQQAHLLLAKKYQQENSPRFDQQLQLAALYTQDRDLFYAIFNEVLEKPVVVKEASPIEKQIKSEITEITEKVIVKQEEPVLPLVEVVIKPIEAPAVETIEQTVTEPLQETETNLYPPIQQKLEEPEQEEIEANELALPDTDEEIIKTEEVVLAPVINEPVHEELSVAEESKSEQAREDLREVPIIEEPVITEKPAVKVLSPALTERTEDLEKVNLEPQFSFAAPHTFDDWIKAFNNKQPVSEPIVEEKTEPVSEGDEPVKDELDTLIKQNASADYLHELVKEETNYSRGLEKFIEDQIQKHKQTEVKKASTEGELDPDLITETMAKVYEMQKKYNRAIKAYEILTLKFPKKSGLFAARINYLKNIV